MLQLSSFQCALQARDDNETDNASVSTFKGNRIRRRGNS